MYDFRISLSNKPITNANNIDFIKTMRAKTETRGRPKKAPEDKSESKYTRIDVHLFTIAESRAAKEGITTRKWIEKLILANEKKSLES